MTTEPRALIAAGRKHDEAMSDAPWHLDGDSSVTCTCCKFGDGTPGEIASVITQPGDAAAIAWFGTHRRDLLDGYASALDEVDALRNRVANVQREAGMQDLMLEQKDEELVTLRTAIGELKLVIEQQDRDMARMKQRIKDQDEELQAHTERSYRTITGAPCTTK